ncbi:DUF2088 domain-containing protein, partial [candidate division WOR-3 bacterium]|nr:DUF2088 domain-containing protein [candidate division WOR-3 bacterium]
KHNNILIIVNDQDRTTPTSSILEVIKSFGGIEKKSSVIIASGTHKIPSPEQLKKIIGNFEPKEILFHDSRDPASCVYFGKSDFGNELFFNTSLTKFETVLAINSVEPHYFAGFTGGRKSFLPGLASFRTIEKNHSLALEPGAMPLKLEGNPVHTEMNQALDFFYFPIYSIQIVGTESEIFNVFTGDIRKSFAEAAVFSESIFSVEIDRLADAVFVEVGEPYSRTLYQAQKAIIHASCALKKNGILCFSSHCREGIGDRGFFDLLSSFSDPRDVLSYLKNEYKFGYHKSFHMAKIVMNHRVLGLTQIDEKTLEKVFVEKIKGKEIFNEIVEREKLFVYHIEKGEMTVPRYFNLEVV